jgi:hypothetical protein
MLLVEIALVLRQSLVFRLMSYSACIHAVSEVVDSVQLYSCCVWVSYLAA